MPYRESELETLLVHSGAKIAVVLGSFKDRCPAGEVIGLRNKIPQLEGVIAVGTPVEGTHDYATVSTTASDSDTVLEADVDAPYLLLYTSGTTAQPKGVAHSSRHFLQNADLASAELGLTSQDRVTSLAPFSHLYGMFTLQIALAAGSCTAMIPAFNPQTFLDDLADLTPTALFTAPAHLPHSLLRPNSPNPPSPLHACSASPDLRSLLNWPKPLMTCCPMAQSSDCGG